MKETPAHCYTPRTSLRSGAVCGLFIRADGTRLIIPDRWLTEACLTDDDRLLRLTYTFCMIEIAGRHLKPILEDVSTGKLGAVQELPSRVAEDGEPWVSSIVMIATCANSEARNRKVVPDA